MSTTFEQIADQTTFKLTDPRFEGLTFRKEVVPENLWDESNTNKVTIATLVTDPADVPADIQVSWDRTHGNAELMFDPNGSFEPVARPDREVVVLDTVVSEDMSLSDTLTEADIKPDDTGC